MTNDLNERALRPRHDDERLRFRGVVDTADDGDSDAPLNAARPSENWIAEEAAFKQADWDRAAERVTFWSRFAAVFIFFLMLIGWPIGTMLGYHARTGSLDGYQVQAFVPMWTIIFAVVAPVLAWLCGYILSRQMTMMGAAESIATVAQQFMQPDETALYNLDAVGHAVRGQMETINSGVDDALIRLASVEAMIRQHVEAIETAGEAIETRTSSAVAKVADERSRLIGLTEQLNAQADDFASAIAVKAQAGIEAIHNGEEISREAEAALAERLDRLERSANQALESFAALANALGDATEAVAGRANKIEASADDVTRATHVVSNVAEAAAEAAARNAANIGMTARRAAEEAKKSADESIEISSEAAARAATSAVEFATREAERVANAAANALENVKKATSDAVSSASEDALRATSAAEQVSDAAQKAMKAASEASNEVRKAGEAARQSAEDALNISKTAKDHSEAQQKQLSEARASLEKENARLEQLIEEQRQRADRLADAIASQTERLSKLAEAQLRQQEARAEIQNGKETAPPNERAPAPSQPAMQPSSDDTAWRPRAKPRDEAPRPQREVSTRLDEMADSIAKARDKSAPPPGQSRSAPVNKKGDVSWKEILTATDDAEPLDLAAETRARERSADAAEAMAIIHSLQNFTLDLETRLYGEPPRALLERFEGGDRNIFANRVLRLNEADVKRRIRTETARNKPFDRTVQNFLQGFERLLEDATTSETADEELEEYLNSPLGRVYLLIGATVGYFA